MYRVLPKKGQPDKKKKPMYLAMAVHPGFTNDDVVGTDLLTISAEGRVEHQKLNQTAP